MNNIFFTSDLHFLHNNIVKHCNRPTTIEEHTQWLLDLVNKDLTDNSQVYHLGDFTGKYKTKYSDIENIISQLKGTWHFIKGNHDNEKQLQNILKGTRHKWLGDYHELKYYGKNIILFHYPISTWNKKHHGSIHLHGHSHGKNRNIISNRHDVGIDIAYRLFNIDEATKPGFNLLDLYIAHLQLHLEDGEHIKLGELLFHRYDIEIKDSYLSDDFEYIKNLLEGTEYVIQD